MRFAIDAHPKPAPHIATEREKLLDEARSAVCQRQSVYGEPEDSFGRIAAVWNVLLPLRDGEWTGAKVALALADVKRVRLSFNPHHRDSQVDLAGYAACAGQCSVAEGESG